MSKQGNVGFDFPEDVFVHIFLNLPIKAILICTCVCKTWNAIIKGPSFISSHLNHSISWHKESNIPLCLLRYCSLHTLKERYSLRFDTQELGKYARIHFPYRSHFGFKIFGSCNGLVCLLGGKSYSTEHLILWNPVIRKSMILPKRGLTGLDSVGLGSDSGTNDYKVLVVSPLKNVSIKAELYSLKANTWKRLRDVESQCQMVTNGPMAFLNGILHFVAYRFQNLILGFDVGGEVCREIMLPDRLAHCHLSDLSVKVCADSLSVLFSSDTNRVFQIWVMKEYGVEGSWTQLSNITMLPWSPLPRVLCFRKNGHVLLSVANGYLMNSPAQIVSYDPKHRMREVLDIQGKHDWFFVDSYIESLVLLDKGNDLSLWYQENGSCDAYEESDDGASSSAACAMYLQGTTSSATSTRSAMDDLCDDSRNDENADLREDSEARSSDYSSGEARKDTSASGASKDLSKGEAAANEELSNNVADDSSFHVSNELGGNTNGTNDAPSK
ncbi:hypothetical protein SLEP1_g49895 [Rubroshorea leprosula]|uniref:F-box domain-containing protein n=1 Tax=Rubroshorea leprosula TaxID=152421 RepID=A0AAV5LY92_9ROSI|nr:hypothetical protein SLEP1_g49895 [Rubroshorea leprosula]